MKGLSAHKSKLKSMRALIDDNLSPIKSNPDDRDFKLKMQPVNNHLNWDLSSVAEPEPIVT